jgi:hypothetical protein
MPDLSITAITYDRPNAKMIVSGTSNANVTVRVIIDPDLSGNPTTEQIYQQYATLGTAYGQLANAPASWQLTVTGVPDASSHSVCVVTSDGKMAQLTNIVPGPNPLPPAMSIGGS